MILVTELGSVIDVRLVQPEKAPPPILVTELGIVIDVRLVQPEKVPSPIFVTELGIVIDVRLVHSQYLEVIDYLFFAVNTAEKWIGIWLKGCGW